MGIKNKSLLREQLIKMAKNNKNKAKDRKKNHELKGNGLLG